MRRTDVVTAALVKVTVADRRAAGEVGLQPAVPLSVAADKIAMAAWRCCALLDALATREVEVVTAALGRPSLANGRVRVFEVYPAASLAIWGVPREGYKAEGAAATDVRRAILTAIERAGAEGWLQWAPDARERCVATDHALDAFVCALVARAALLGLVEPVSDEDVEAARAEGWIAVPRRDGLKSLLEDASRGGGPTPAATTV
ncbi:MAG: DUF429 domain-containing protein [Myxococcaceae bacterium]|nr:MAG: DUF429 domain-containing protein [Myxococcaceae bacterium]